MVRVEVDTEAEDVVQLVGSGEQASPSG